MSAGQAWAEALRAWAIPEEILRSAPEPPFGFPTELFRRRGEAAADQPPSPTTRRALEALPSEGSVLDVGVGGGATSLPLAGRAAEIAGVDEQQDMLDAFGASAERTGVSTTLILGRWPDVADDAPRADVVVCGHVAFNVPDLGPFALALHEHAAMRVVMELTDRHPLAWMNDLWLTFHDVRRPTGPTADDAIAVLAEVGIGAERDDHSSTDHPAGHGFARREDAIALIRRRLCLGADRDRELAAALGDRLREHDGLWNAGPNDRGVVTLWWDV